MENEIEEIKKDIYQLVEKQMNLELAMWKRFDKSKVDFSSETPKFKDAELLKLREEYNSTRLELKMKQHIWVLLTDMKAKKD